MQNGQRRRSLGQHMPQSALLQRNSLYTLIAEGHSPIMPQRRSQVCAPWLQADCPVFSEGEDQHSVLQAAALATKWWEPARDALDTMVLDAAKLHELEGFQHTDFVPFDPAVKVQFLPCLPISQHIVV